MRSAKGQQGARRLTQKGAPARGRGPGPPRRVPWAWGKQFIASPLSPRTKVASRRLRPRSSPFRAQAHPPGFRRGGASARLPPQAPSAYPQRMPGNRHRDHSETTVAMTVHRAPHTTAGARPARASRQTRAPQPRKRSQENATYHVGRNALGRGHSESIPAAFIR